MTDTIELLCQERDRGRCFRCGAELSALWPGYSCHHRQTRALGVHGLRNRIMLCGSGTTGCHGWVHNHVATARAEGWIVSRYLDPQDEPARHHEHGYVWLRDNGDIIDEHGQPIGG